MMKLIRTTLPVILRKYGFEVTVASTVPEALEQIEKDEFELLLCDLNIDTAADGYDVVRAMQRVNPGCDLLKLIAQIVLTSGAAKQPATMSE